ncbi:MAG TPA: hypothetical protein VLA71_12305 [Algoriphagus sp.]|nr:hypothetical protein [Algoriphagus sp.]
MRNTEGKITITMKVTRIAISDVGFRMCDFGCGISNVGIAISDLSNVEMGSRGLKMS